jgi:hypothetical protein
MPHKGELVPDTNFRGTVGFTLNFWVVQVPVVRRLLRSILSGWATVLDWYVG